MEDLDEEDIPGALECEGEDEREVREGTAVGGAGIEVRECNDDTRACVIVISLNLSVTSSIGSDGPLELERERD